ncbi:MAG: 23S rRNA (adenine(2503)-C(2))-methyltransferase RlmN [Firmicutes bacterium]|nr:23S rRNA (adenine(2503)-C(2))-methyltransferase RlmN [Bacillota bacterium]
MKLLQDLSLSEIQNILKSLAVPGYRAEQLFKWITKGVPLADMTNIPKELKNELSKRFLDHIPEIVKVVKATDGTEKYLYKLHDGELIEGVYLPNNYGNTLCISTQVGCRMGCVFCASGINGLLRNLSVGEIVGQYISATKRRQELKPQDTKPISNIVFMGSGEPLDNYDNSIDAIRLLCCDKGLNISIRNISLSTCGLVPEILKLADEGLGLTLSVSLHATTDILRRELIPIAKKYSLSETMNATKKYFEKTGRRVCIEYALIEDNNDAVEDAKRLANLVKGFSSHINLIKLNTHKTTQLKTSSEKSAKVFLSELEKLNLSASIRRSQGSEILGACGQLRGKFVGDNKG